MKTSQLNIIDRYEKAGGRLNFLGYAACAFKHEFRDGLDEVLADYERKTGISLISHVPPGCGSEDEIESDGRREVGHG
jgi:hypothetical protein